MVMVIAECGINHNGIETEAYKLIDAAIEAGADVAKFQLFKAEGSRSSLQWLCLPLHSYPRLNEYCKEKGIGFACTAFDVESLEWLLRSTKMVFIKIASAFWGDNDLMKLAAKSGLPIIISSRDNADLERMKWIAPDVGVTILHCAGLYPTPLEMENLTRISTWRNFRELFGHTFYRVGFSDHSASIYPPLAAVSIGAEVIECHITLDRNQEGPDHKASLDPQQFKEMVRGIRAIERAMA